MIINDFYPTVTDKTSIMGMAYTAELQSIPITTPEFTQAYWLGWMRWENLPLQYHVSRSTFEDGVLTFTDVTKTENVPVGFSIHNDNNIDIYKWAYSGVKYNGTKWVNIDYAYSSNASRYFYLPNNLDVNTVSWGRLRLIFLAMSEDRTITLEKITADVPYADFAAGNNMTATIGDSGAFNGQTFTVTKDDISSHAIFQKEINNTVFDIVLASYTIPYNRDCRFDNNVDDFAAVHPMVEIHTTDDIPYVSGVTNPVQFQFADDCRWGSGYWGQGFQSNWSGAVNSLTAFNNSGVYDWCGGFVGSFQVSDLTPGTVNLIVPDGATFYVRGVGRSDFFIIGRILTYDEILHCLSLIPRLQESGTNRYEQDATYWYGHVDYDTNEFLGDLINGSQLNKLVDWQLLNHNIVDNDFTEDEIPDYRPPGPSPADTEDKFIGDNVADSKYRDFTVNGVQYYALNSRLVQDFCERLWSQPKSFYEAIQIAGRQQNSIFDFIESLRYYPVNWEFIGEAETVHMGTGAVLLNSDGTTPVQYSNVTNGVITGYNIGSWHLSDNDYHWRNNFLDYSPYTKISAYIPYFGTIELDPASIAAFGPISEAEIYLDISMDISTGCMTAYLSTHGGCVLAQKTTKIAIDLYLSGNDATAQSAAILRSQFNTTKSVLGGVLSPMSALGSGNATAAVAGLGSAYANIGSAYLENSLAKKQIPVEVQSQGGTASNIYRVQTPYLTIHRQKISNPDNYGHTTGYLVDGTYTINSLSGFTICRNVDASGISKAIDKEKAEIKKILESGFYA